MYAKQDKGRSAGKILPIGLTVLAFALGAEIILNGWDKGTLVRLAVEIAACWALYISRKMPEKWLMWVYFAAAMDGFVFFGTHESSIYVIAPLVIGIFLLFFSAEIYSPIPFCALFYFGVLAYDIINVFSSGGSFAPPEIARLLFCIAFVVTTGLILKKTEARRKSKNADIEELISRLKEENRRTEDFLTNVSHELRTPINAVTGLTAVMLKNENDPEKRENLISVQKAGYRLFGQIEDILDYTEIDTERISISDEAYMMSSIVNDIITELNMTGTKPSPEIIFDIDAKIPAGLYGDGRKIKKIIKHLISNAVKFTDEGGVYVRIYALKKTYGVNLCILVKDTGIGMKAESLSRITERFYQSSRGYKRRAGGLGLGLPIVYGMVKAMEGFVHIESEYGKGTSVTVSIPQKIADNAAGMQVEKPSELCLACYLMPEKYKNPEVRMFYDEMITHITQGLDVTAHRVFNITELETLVSRYRLTHLFVAKEEYEKDADYIEKLAEDIIVVVVSDDAGTLRAGSRARIMHKPFYCFPVVNVLNSSAEDQTVRGQRMVCPDVKALVVDDEPMNRLVAEGILKDYQMSVKTAGSGAEAVSICESEDFDVIFLDHMMPEMDGVETLKMLRKLKNDPTDMFTVVAFTANAVSGSREMFLREGFDDFLSKPVESAELERVLRKVLPNSRIKFIAEKEIEENIPAAEKPAEKKDVPVKDEENTDPIAVLEKAGINTRAGLTYCRKDKDFYIQILSKFVSDANSKASELERLFAASDWDGYRIQVHALKSSSKMLGADILSQKAKELEDASKEHDAEFVGKNHGALTELFKETVKIIGSAVGLEKSDDGENSKCEEIDAETLLNTLSELLNCFGTYEADKAQKLLGDLSRYSYGGEPLKKTLDSVSRDVDEFEYESASEKTSALIGRVKGGDARE